MSKAKAHSPHTQQREPRSDLEDLRDDTIAVVLNSGLKFAQIEAQGGPTRNTISKWLYKETRFPRLDTVRSILTVCGYDLTILPTQLNRSPAAMVADLRPKTTQTLPTRKAAAKRHMRASAKRKGS